MNIRFLIVGIIVARLTPVSPAERKIADWLCTVSHCHCSSSSVLNDTATAFCPRFCSLIPPVRFFLCLVFHLLVFCLLWRHFWTKSETDRQTGPYTNKSRNVCDNLLLVRQMTVAYDPVKGQWRGCVSTVSVKLSVMTFSPSWRQYRDRNRDATKDCSVPSTLRRLW